MAQVTHQLKWIPEVVAKVMAINGIHDRAELSRRINVRRSTVYNNISRDWSGLPSTYVLGEVAGTFNVSISELVTDPGKRLRKPPDRVQKTRQQRMSRKRHMS